MARILSRTIQLGPELSGLEVRTYYHQLAKGESFFSSEVELSPGDRIVVDGLSASQSERRLQELIPVSLICRKVEGSKNDSKTPRSND
jgi:hypothetical protein